MGLLTEMQLDEFMKKRRLLREQAARIYEKAGVSGRAGEAAASLTEGFLKMAPFGVVLYCAECALGTRNPLQYMTKVLKSWQQAGVDTVEKAKARQETPAAAGPAGAVPTAMQFEQRTYTDEELRSFTVDLSAYMEENKR